MSRGVLIGDVLDFLEAACPLAWQEPWDRSGLQIGSRHEPVRGILVAYDFCREVARSAHRQGANLLITHHPLGLKPLDVIDWSTYSGDLIRLACQWGLTVYAAHTNHDASPAGMNGHAAKLLGLTAVQPLRALARAPFYKLITFVPPKDLAAVRAAVFAAGGGRIGHYESCSFATPGQGSFLGGAGTKPTIGRQGRLEEVGEMRLEVLVHEGKLARAVAAMKLAHPYEEVAYDVVPLANPWPQVGVGRRGELVRPTSVKVLARRLKQLFGCPRLRVSGPLDRPLKRIALCMGSGSGLLDEALLAGADALITGDVRYHAAVEAARHDLVLFDIGHFYSEVKSVELLAGLLRQRYGKHWPVRIYRGLKDPFVAL